jgi:hypothetical protein
LLAAVVSGLLLFLTLTGLSILFLDFSEPNQVMVLLHTVLGIVFLFPYIWYQIRHWLIYRRATLTHIKLTGWLSLAATAVACISGLILTYQAAFGTRISYFWDLVHIVATFAIIAAILPHIVAIVWRIYRASKQEAVLPIRTGIRRFTSGTTIFTVACFALVVAMVVAYRPVQLNNEFPEDYNFLYGEDRPFVPSLARTNTGGAFDPRSLGGSQSCGTDGCHTEIVEEWSVSAHRWSAMDPAFRAVQNIMGEQNGAESTRYCGGCHDPISLFGGSKNLFRDDLTDPIGFDEGVSCIVCHGIEETDVQGNANYVIHQPARYMFELSDDDAWSWVSDFLIRAYPKEHIESLQHKLFKSPEFCASCHKQFIDEEINNVGWVQLQNQYDNWRESRWNHPGDPTKTIECRECHMPLVSSMDPASGDELDYNRTTDDDKHRSHRFLGANQFMPTHLQLPGGEEQVELVNAWLRGDVEIPEIADKWQDGPAVPIELHVPDEVMPGQEVPIRVSITNNKLGHDFPTGPLDIIQAWIEVEVTDDAGNVIFSSGTRNEGHFIEPGAFMFKAEPVDQYGNLIDRHNLWEMVGVRYRRALFPGFSDQAQYTVHYPASLPEPVPEQTDYKVDIPGDRQGHLNVKARLLYRKVDQYLLNVLFGEDSGVTSPVSVISEAEERIRIGT